MTSSEMTLTLTRVQELRKLMEIRPVGETWFATIDPVGVDEWTVRQNMTGSGSMYVCSVRECDAGEQIASAIAALMNAAPDLLAIAERSLEGSDEPQEMCCPHGQADHITRCLACAAQTPLNANHPFTTPTTEKES